MIKVGKIGTKDEILTVQYKQISGIVNKSRRILEMAPWQREVEARRLNFSKMQIKKII